MGNLPFVRLLAAAGAGILLAWIAVGWGYYALGAGIAWLSAMIFRKGTFSIPYTWLSVMLFFAAVTSFSQKPGSYSGSGSRVVAEIIVGEEPVAAGKWKRAAGRIVAYREVGGREWSREGFGVQLYLDSAARIAAADRLILTGTFYPFTGQDGSYGRLMVRRGIEGRFYGYADGILAFGRPAGLPAGSRLHNAAVRKFSRLRAAGPASVAAAMMTGDKRFISGEIRQAYADGGGAHLLAVSGLHVGIVFVLVNLLLYFIPAVRRGHIVKNLVAVALVWLFALAAGMSPSVTRAALMFSFAQFALARGTGRDAVNILAASAFLMLAVRPGYAADPSFVLSYAAVLSIVLFFGPVFKLVKTGNRFVGGILSVYIVGIAASLAAAPFVSYWFGKVPLAGIVVNPLVILTAHIIVAVGVLWLVWPSGVGAAVFAKLLGAAEWCQNTVMGWCAGQQWGQLEVRLSLGMALLAYALIIFSAVCLGRYSRSRAESLTLPQ